MKCGLHSRLKIEREAKNGGKRGWVKMINIVKWLCNAQTLKMYYETEREGEREKERVSRKFCCEEAKFCNCADLFRTTRLTVRDSVELCLVVNVE